MHQIISLIKEFQLAFLAEKGRKISHNPSYITGRQESTIFEVLVGHKSVIIRKRFVLNQTVSLEH